MRIVPGCQMVHKALLLHNEDTKVIHIPQTNRSPTRVKTMNIYQVKRSHLKMGRVWG